MACRYISREAADQHVSEPHFKKMFTILEKEGLMAREPYVAKTITVAGFDLDRAFIESAPQ